MAIFWNFVIYILVFVTGYVIGQMAYEKHKNEEQIIESEEIEAEEIEEPKDYILIQIRDQRPIGYITPKEFSERTMISYSKVRKMISQGEISVLKIGTDNWIEETVITDMQNR